MVIHEVNSTCISKKLDTSVKSSATLKHHVQELAVQNELKNITLLSSDIDKRKSKKGSGNKSKAVSHYFNMESTFDREITEIDENDLEELRTVYKKCKAVMKKIESKYGHLLNLEAVGTRSKKRKCSDAEDTDSNVCTCPTNKKIVFDDDGHEITSGAVVENHICVKKLKRTRSTDHVNPNHVQVEYEAVNSMLPDDLNILTNMLQDPQIENKYRNEVISKIKKLRQEYLDEVRFNKQFLIDKLKVNPEEIFEFKGANLKSLPGYPIV